MTARFTETEKWRDKWFRRLPPTAKLAWLWMCDNCDIGGFLEVDEQLMAQELGVTEAQAQGAMKHLERGYVGGGEWIWLRNFLKHQKNLPLNTANAAHRGILRRFDDRKPDFPSLKESVLEVSPLQAPCKPLPRGTGKGKGIGIGNRGGSAEGGDPKPPKPKTNGFKAWTRDDFAKSCATANHDEILTAAEIEDFMSYWNEPSSSGIPKFKLQRTWDTRRRMNTALRLVYSNDRGKTFRGEKMAVEKNDPNMGWEPN